MPNLAPRPLIDDEDRRSLRYRLLLQAEAQHGETGCLSATIHNLSSRGLLLETSSLLPIGSEVLLELPAVGTVAAEVVRHEEGLAGCEFRSRLPDAAVRRALRESPVAWLQPLGGSAAERKETPSETEIGQEPVAEPEPATATGWPLRAKFGFIVGTSILLWALILGAIAISLGGASAVA